ncbi:MAG: pyruvate formate lyase family protein [Oscillospiraceae bacterium]|nr:pyruvate formate lyase family protein [Oscillospiraceae bacterium]
MTDRIQHLRELFFAGAHKAYRVESLDLSILNKSTETLPFAIRKAMAFACALEHMPIFLLEGDLICGGKTVYQLPTYVTEEEKRWGNHNFECEGYSNIFDSCYNLGQDERGFSLNDSSVPAYYKVLPQGIPARITEAKERLAAAADPEQITYYRSIILANEACLLLMNRYEELCLEQADSAVSPRKEELLTMAANMKQLQNGPPQNFWQAVQLLYFIQFLIWVEGGYLIPLGRLDRTLYPFFRQDMDSGLLDRDFAFEILEAFFMKLNYEVDRTHGGKGRINSDTGQSVTIGGCDPETGEPSYNELTLMILDAKCDMRVTDPKVHLRVSSKTPAEIWKKAAYLTSLGMGFPTYENDDAIIPALLSYPEYSLADARDYAASGCWEMTVQGRALNRNMGGVCALRMVELAMNNGQFFLGTPGGENAVGLIGDRYGIPTGEPEWFDTFPKFFNAFRVQMKHHIDMVTSYVNRSMISPSPFYSSMMEGPMECGRDFDAYGMKYNETDFQLCSLSNAADALFAIRKLVYEDREYSLRQLRNILLNNWEGHEALRQRILHKFPKFGNNQPEVDALANDIVACFVQEVTKQRNAAGQTYRARVSSATSYIYGSRILGASADGRRAREFYADNLSPMIGADRNGPTAIVLSCGNVDFSRCAGGAVLDMKFHPSSLSTEESRDKFIALLKTYFRLGGLQIQINVLDNKILLDAQKHPENYPDLMVRIWGFSTYFVTIDKHWQDHIIARSTLAF